MGVVTDEECALAEDESMSSGEGVVDTLITKGVVMAIQVSQAKAAQLGVEFVEIAEQTIEDDVISSVPRSVAHQYKVVPLYHDDLSVTVAMSDPSDLDAIDALGQALNKEVKISVADADEIEDALKQYYGASKDDSVSKLIQDITEADVQTQHAWGSECGGGWGCRRCGHPDHQAGEHHDCGGVPYGRVGHSSRATGCAVSDALQD